MRMTLSVTELQREKGDRSAVDEDEKMYPYNKELTEYSKELRKNMTAEEKHLWYDFL